MYVDDHGGDCCGRQHLSEFPSTPTSFEINFIKNELSRCQVEGDDDEGIEDRFADELCWEVTLIDNQRCLKAGDSCGVYSGLNWDQILLKMGFEMVYSFINPNTDNQVYVYLYSSAKC